MLSPTLFNIFLEQSMMDALNSLSSGMKIKGQVITNLHFADDIDLICSNEEDIRRPTSILDITSRKYGMEINAEKSRIMIVGKERKVLAQTMQVMGKDLETVDSFKHLGRKVTADGKCSDEVHNRLAMATSSLRNLSNIWRNSSSSIKAKYRLLATKT